MDSRSCVNRLVIVLLLGAGLSIAHAAKTRLDPLQQWGQWRGPLATGAANQGDPPIRWSEEQNVRWKTAIPGLGHSTPIVWGDRIYFTSAEEHGDPSSEPVEGHDHGAHDNVAPRHRMRFIVHAVNRADGSYVWQTTVRDSRPHEAVHETGTWASNSAVTDGEHLYVSFGSQGIYCLDMQGAVIWEIDLGDMRTRHEHGEGSSPALWGDTLVVVWDHQGESFLVALNKKNGKQRWRVPRDEITSWSSPLIVEHAGKPQVVISATKRVRGYDLSNGKLIWEVGGLSRNVVATPVAADGLVFAANSYDWRALLAIRLAEAKGDITDGDAVVWTRDRDTPYVPSPVLDGGSLCFIKHLQAVLTCVEAKTGKPQLGPQRLEGLGMIFSSPTAAAGRIYVPSRNGATAVIDRREKKLLSINRLDDSFSASPAIVDDELILRGERHLYSISRPSSFSSSSAGSRN